MEFFNFRGEASNIHHFQGRDDIMKDLMQKEFNTIINRKLVCPEDLTIITTFTNKDKAILCKQLDKWNINYINSVKESDVKFSIPEKISAISDVLKNVKTEYTLILDAYDVLIYSFDFIIEKFLSEKCAILFNASKNNYPVIAVDKIPFRDYLGQYNHFNAGCCIGHTPNLQSFYNDCEQTEKKINNIFNSEQYILRHVFAKACEQMLMDYCPIKFDYNCNVFLALGNSVAEKIDDNKDFYKMM